MHGNVGKNIISLLDLFGFEDFAENSFEQLCINYANESLQYYINKLIFKTEQAEYAKEKIEWTPIGYHDNNAILHILSKKPVCSNLEFLRQFHVKNNTIFLYFAGGCVPLIGWWIQLPQSLWFKFPGEMSL